VRDWRNQTVHEAIQCSNGDFFQALKLAEKKYRALVYRELDEIEHKKLRALVKAAFEKSKKEPIGKV